jgi:transposase
MIYVGTDLHKQIIVMCAVKKVRGKTEVVERAKFACANQAAIERFFQSLGRCEVAVEATASYEWFVQLVEPFTQRVVLVHPRKMRVIAESKCKTDKADAQLLAEFLADDSLPLAYRPTPRVRAHRQLVRYRMYVQGRITSVKNKVRRILSDYNADVRNLFTAAGQEHLVQVPLSEVDRWMVEQLVAELAQHQVRLREVDRQLRAFAKAAPLAEREAEALLKTIPLLGPVTRHVLLAEIGDWRRFRSAARLTGYSGLAPGIRQSAGKTKELGITKQGSRALRWALVQWAWRMATRSAVWKGRYEKLKLRRGAKKAIVAIARRLLGVVYAVLKKQEPYRLVAA